MPSSGRPRRPTAPTGRTFLATRRLGTARDGVAASLTYGGPEDAPSRTPSSRASGWLWRRQRSVGMVRRFLVVLVVAPGTPRHFGAFVWNTIVAVAGGVIVCSSSSSRTSTSSSSSSSSSTTTTTASSAVSSSVVHALLFGIRRPSLIVVVVVVAVGRRWCCYLRVRVTHGDGGCCNTAWRGLEHVSGALVVPSGEEEESTTRTSSGHLHGRVREK